ncbi:peptidase T [Perkinsela sp. CCAP 1560/4]|nr:peptidase T [Perkinsela sp. CCAP 1560/4]|eukprot:KNH06677.1 peptidase T [Perkinsela sp. CCAP 1560/4]
MKSTFEQPITQPIPTEGEKLAPKGNSSSKGPVFDNTERSRKPFKERKKNPPQIYGRDSRKEMEYASVTSLLKRNKNLHISSSDVDRVTQSVYDASQRHNMISFLERIQLQGIQMLVKPMSVDDISEVEDAHLSAKLKEFHQEKWRRKAEERRQWVKSNGEKYNKSVISQVLLQVPPGPGFAAGRGRPQTGSL